MENTAEEFIKEYFTHCESDGDYFKGWTTEQILDVMEVYHQSKLKDRGDIGTVMTSSPTEKHHVCGLNGFDQMLGDKCNVCDES